MSVETIGDHRSTPNCLPKIDASETWGTASRFRRLARVDPETAAYWLVTVHRPAHRIGHPKLNVEGCPGCTFEAPAKAEVA